MQMTVPGRDEHLKLAKTALKIRLQTFSNIEKHVYNIARYILYIQSYIADSDGLRRLPMEIGKEFSCCCYCD